MKHLLYIICLWGLLLLSPGSASCQKEGNVWLFGYGACIDFNSGKPVPLNINTPINTREGCSSICDSAGQLLFYTDGTFVWNRNHKQMPNGNAMLGNISSTQSSLLVKMPGSDSLYYIFTNDCIENYLAGGLNYNVVNIRANGGLGDVIIKNRRLNASSSEKLAATLHTNGKDIWIVSHDADSNVYNAYLLNTTGISTKPVKSYVGTWFSKSKNINANAGCITISPDGSKLANALYGDNRVEVFNFNSSNGQLKYWFQINKVNAPYGVGFSSNSTVLYAGYGGYKGFITQYDLSGKDTSKIVSNGYNLSQRAYFGDIQLGPDKKLYSTFAFTDTMLIINFPNQIGSGCSSSKLVMPNQVVWGLPNMMQSYFANSSISYTAGCYFDSAHFEVTGNTPDSVIWYLGDPGSQNNISRKLSFSHLYPVAGSYNVLLVSYKRNTVDSIKKTITVYGKPRVIDSTIYLCPNKSVIINISNAGYTYHWSDSSKYSTYYISSANKYWVRVNNVNCTTIDTFHVLAINSTLTSHLTDTIICNKDSVTFDVTKPLATYTWQDGNMSPVYTVHKNGIYTAIIHNLCGNDTGIFKVAFQKKLITPKWKDTSICPGDTLVMDASQPGATYKWQDGSTLPNYTIRKAGSYFVTIKTYCDSVIAKINVSYGSKIRTPKWHDTTICEGASVFLDASQGGVTYLWQDSSTKGAYLAKKAGFYSVKIMTHCDTAMASIHIKYFGKLNHFNFHDTMLCNADSLVIGVKDSNATSFRWQDSSSKATYTVKKAGFYHLITKNTCESIYRSVSISYMSAPLYSGLKDTTLCDGDSALFRVYPYGASYFWQNGSKDPFINVSEAGTYWLHMTNRCGTRIDTMHVKYEDCTLYLQIPNVFSPDGNGINDIYKALLSRIPRDYDLSVYNRWGELVFRTTDYTQGWDGNFHHAPALEGVYLYVLNAKGYRHEDIHRSGTVMLIRQ